MEAALECENSEQDFLCRVNADALAQELDRHCIGIAPQFEAIDNEINRLLAAEYPPLGRIREELEKELELKASHQRIVKFWVGHYEGL